MTSFSQRSLDFLYFNHKYNSKTWYKDHKEDFKKYLSIPFTDLAVKMAPHMLRIDEQFITEPKSIISRIYKDLRFAYDKTSLYRDHMWITFMRDKNQMHGLPGFFFEVSPYNFKYGCGYYCADAKSMASIKELVLSNSKAFKKAKKCYENQEYFTLIGETYKRAHYPDQPEDIRLWLEKKDMCLMATSQDIELLFSDNLADTLAERFERIKPIYDFFITAESLARR